MQQNRNSIRAMETRDHFKNGASSKSQMSRRHFLLFCILLLALGNVTAQSIKLDKTKLELIVGEEQILKATTNPAGQSITWRSSDTNKATVDVEVSYGEAKVIAKTAGTVSINAIYGGQTISCTVTIYDVFSQTSVTINGVTWATCNVDKPGTFAVKATDAGMFYQWNRKIGWSTTDPLTSSPSGRSWDSSNASGTTWEAANDPCPDGWRVPTYQELDKLRKAGRFQATVDGKNGMKFGNSNNIIFLPGAGSRSPGFLFFTNGERAFTPRYWSATEYGSDNAYMLDESHISVDRAYARSNAYNIRCVKK